MQQARAAHLCWCVAAAAIDDTVAKAFLDALTPDAVALAQSMMKDAERQCADLDRQWQLRLEGARYEVHLTERRYKAVDPENRTVARTLEREWDEKLCALGGLERDYSAARAREKLALTPEDQARLVTLSGDVPRIWSAPTTTMAQRKMMVRTLVQEVCLQPQPEPEGGTAIRILWQAGTVTEHQVPRQLPGRRTPPAALTMIRDMVAKATPAGKIAAALNEAEILTATGRSWSSAGIHAYCHHHKIRWPRRMPSSLPRPLRRADGAYSARGVAQRLHVAPATVLYWHHRGWLETVDGGGRGRARWFQLDKATISRLKRVKMTHTRPRRQAE